MSLAITGVVALVLLLLAWVGAWRDIQRGLLALVATFFGIVLSSLWGERWGNQLAAQLDVASAPIVFMISSLLLASVALLIGYGGGILLPPAPRSLSWQRRAAGGALGLLNGIVLIGYLLQYSTHNNPGFAELIAEATPVQLLYDGVPLLLLISALVGSALIIGKQIILSLRRRKVPPAPPNLPSARPPATPLAGTPPPTAEQRENQQRALEKINDRLR